ncbi:MAG TPA: hypothetical protein VKX39_16305 [Bryobacteraceae bacterium]|jgi:hypothetical protein|nr:hypothetical protein [Bryobacteraceae bacterium]
MTALPLRRCWHPMGHAVEIATNSENVLSGAARVWDEYTALSHSPPVELRVEAAGGARSGGAVVTCQMEHFLSITQDSRNFAIADLRRGTGFVRVTRDAAEDSQWLAYHFLEPVAYVLLAARHFAMIHAAAVIRNGAAVLLCGSAGAGKTCLAYACARRGWSFLTGDAAHLQRRCAGSSVIGRPFLIRFRESAKLLFPELNRYEARVRPNGKCDFEIDPRRLGLNVSLEAPAAAVVLLDRREGPGRLLPLSAADARDLLNEAPYLGDRQARAEQHQTLKRLLARPAMRLSYSDLCEAEALLRGLVD